MRADPKARCVLQVSQYIALCQLLIMSAGTQTARGRACSLVGFLVETLRHFLPSSRTQQAGAPTGLFGAAPAAAAAGSVSEGAAERREEFMLDSLVCAVEVLFFIYYSYQAREETGQGGREGGRETKDNRPSAVLK